MKLVGLHVLLGTVSLLSNKYGQADLELSWKVIRLQLCREYMTTKSHDVEDLYTVFGAATEWKQTMCNE